MYSYSSRDFVYEPQKMHTSLCSISVDDDLFDCKWPPSSPKRCDRGQSFCMDSAAWPPHASAISSGSADSMRTRESVFSCCTEELGSESTSGVGHAFTAPMSYCNQNIFYEDHITSMPAEAARIWTSTHQSHAATWRGTQSEDVSPPLSRNPPQICSPEGQPLCQYGHECHRRRCAPCGNVRRTFPPPLSSLLCHRPFMRSFKSNGRFILKKIDNVSRSLFRSTRKDGRLRLDLLSCPCDGLHDKCSSLFPANSGCLSPMSAPSVGKHHYHLDVPPTLSLKWKFSSTLASYKPTLSCKTLSPQALSMLMHSRNPCTSVEEPKSPPSSSIAKCQGNVKTTSLHFLPRPVPPHFFALLNLFPVGLGLIILEFGQSKYGNFVTLYGVYILKGLGFQCTRDSIALSRHPFFINLHGIGAKFPEEKLVSSEYSCKK